MVAGKKASANKLAINNAFNLVGKKPNADADNARAILPTARTRKALDFLVQSTPQSLAEEGTPLKPLLQDLFNWDGGNHVNKPLVRAFQNALNVPGKYPHAVELTGYLAALAPLLEADQLARMFSLVDNIETAFAPTKYTMQLSEKLNTVFKEFSSERRERLAHSLWEQSHSGRWWNLTAGIAMEEEEIPLEHLEEKTAEEIFTEIKQTFSDIKNNRTLNNFQGNALEWNMKYQEVFSKIPMSQEIALLSEEYSAQLEAGDFVHPDIAVYLSSLPWLSPAQRPESPVGGLLKFLIQVVENIENHKAPKKPRQFSDLFPSVYLQVGSLNEYPLFPAIRKMHGIKLADNHKVNVIKNRVGLAENAKFMGNCSLSYENRAKKGEYVMLFIDNGKVQHNVGIVLNKNNKWALGEINTRYNRSSDVSPIVKNEIRKFVDSLPPVSDDYHTYLNNLSSREDSSHVFSYSLY